MIKSRNSAVWAIAGLALALIAGSPIYADDVELLLTTPASNDAAKPNILFILDSSGSMTTQVIGQRPYDPHQVYTGDCLTDYLYWSNNGLPACGSDNQQQRYRILRTSFVCDQGNTQIAATGSYGGVLAQYRIRNGSGTEKWDTADGDNETGLIDCQGDSGIHGSGDKNLVYASSISNGIPYTSDILFEIQWRSFPNTVVYAANYINWFNSPPASGYPTRNDIVRAVTRNLLGSMNNVNVGFMRFNTSDNSSSDGGLVTHALKDLDSNRVATDAIVTALPASGTTPLAETMYEAALYWQGLDAEYGPLSRTDPGALVSTSPMTYKRPPVYACSKNYNVLLSDGAPNSDTDSYNKVDSLPGWARVLGHTRCIGGNSDGACLDDITEYLSKTDINLTETGQQYVTTYTIGFGLTGQVPVLENAAYASGGKYYSADDVTSLTQALMEIVNNIFDRGISFTAPAVAVNAFNRTQNLNDLYVSVFRASTRTHWPGNLKKYSIDNAVIVDKNGNPAVDPTTGFFAKEAHNFWNSGATPDGAIVFQGGAANILPDPASRRVFTNNGYAASLTDPTNAISQGNILNFLPADFGLAGNAGEPEVARLIEWVRGVDVRDQDNNPNTNIRYDMGDALHAQPAAVVYGKIAGTENPDVIVYTATNDGYLHAIDANTGKELWAFIPKDLLPLMSDLFFDESVTYKNYGLDGDLVPIIKDTNNDGIIEKGVDFAYLVFGMRRGGSKYYALDITDKNAPKMKWVKTFPGLGQTWSAPVAAKIDISSVAVSSPDKAVLIIGGGYDTVHDTAIHPITPDAVGTGIYILDLETGDQIWSAGRLAGDLQLAGMTRAIPSRIRVLDMSGDGLADRMYAADLGGQVWRFDITNGATPASLVAGGVIAQLGAEGTTNPTTADTRRFYSSPDISLFTDLTQNKRYLALSIGSGYRAHPLDKTNTDRFYSLRDDDVFNSLTQTEYSNYSIITDSELVEVSGQLNTVVPKTSRGWKFTLPPNEKILVESTTFDNAVFFVSFEPSSESTDPCQAGLSINRLYRVAVDNGDPVVIRDYMDPSDPDSINAERVTQLEQGGIAPSPTFLFPSPTDPDCEGRECSPPPVGCVGMECFNPGFANNPVRTLWTQDGVN